MQAFQSLYRAILNIDEKIICAFRHMFNLSLGFEEGFKAFWTKIEPQFVIGGDGCPVAFLRRVATLLFPADVTGH